MSGISGEPIAGADDPRIATRQIFGAEVQALAPDELSRIARSLEPVLRRIRSETLPDLAWEPASSL